MLLRKIENPKTAFRVGMLALLVAILGSWVVRPTSDFAAGLVAGVRIGLYFLALLMVWRSKRLAQGA
jgi:hypothetical protein